MNRIGFNTIGKPKVNGSLILKTPGAALKLPTIMYRLFLRPTNQIAKIKPNVAPVPPKLTN